MKSTFPLLFTLLFCLSCSKSEKETAPKPELSKKVGYQAKPSLLLPESGSTTNTALLDGQWSINYIAGEKFIYHPNYIAISNSGSDIAARAGCNYMLVRFTLLNGSLQPFHTQMSALGCMGNADNDKALWEAMRKLRHYAVSNSGVWLKDSLGNVLIFAQRQ